MHACNEVHVALQVDGGDLFDMLANLSQHGTTDSNNTPRYRMEEKQAKPMFRDMVKAIEFMHSKGVSTFAFSPWDMSIPCISCCGLTCQVPRFLTMIGMLERKGDVSNTSEFSMCMHVCLLLRVSANIYQNV
jgi:hypothetical protein